MAESGSQLTVKTVLIGDAGVGKSSIFRRLENKPFEMDYVPGVNGSYQHLALRGSDGCEADIGLWDTAGSEVYRSLVPMYFQGAQIIVCVFDLTSPPSFDHVTEWIELARNRAPPNVQLLLIGNKSDLDSERRINLRAAQDLLVQIGAKAYIETSALNGTGIDLLKTQLVILVTQVPIDPGVVDPGVVDPVGPESATQDSIPGRCLKRC